MDSRTGARTNRTSTNLMKELTYKAVTITTNDFKIIDVDVINTTTLKKATLLVKDVQQFEIKQNYSKDTSHSYSLNYAQKVGIVESEEPYKILVLGQDNEWYGYLEPEVMQNWNDAIWFEWEDYIKEIL